MLGQNLTIISVDYYWSELNVATLWRDFYWSKRNFTKFRLQQMFFEENKTSRLSATPNVAACLASPDVLSTSDKYSLAKEVVDLTSIAFGAYFGLVNVTSTISGAHTSVLPIWFQSSLALIIPPRRLRLQSVGFIALALTSIRLQWSGFASVQPALLDTQSARSIVRPTASLYITSNSIALHCEQQLRSTLRATDLRSLRLQSQTNRLKSTTVTFHKIV